MAVRTFLGDRGDTGRRLDLVLRRYLANLESATRTRVQTWIATGTVSINGQTVRRAAARVAAGDVLTVVIPDAAVPPQRTIEPQDVSLQILFEDEHLLAVNKPAGIVVHPSHAHQSGTLLNALAWHARDWPAPARPSIVGRLDKLTSGIVLVAKNAALHARLQRSMANTSTEKDYLAIVYGRVKVPRGKIDLRLRRDPVDRRRVVASTSAGAPSLTYFERLAQLPPARIGVALLKCRLMTGRTHQIRVHLAARGWPIVGDPLYAGSGWSRIADRQLGETLRAFPRQALHAWRLSFTHPGTMQRLVLEAPVPADMRSLMCTLNLTSG
ncbi:MAG: RluA family pseudouridine synthase [Vicinamibacterales bacterium]